MMKLPALLPARFINREKRFFIHTNIGTAHCPNTGSLKSVLDQPIRRIWLSDHGENSGRKLRYTAEIVELETGAHVVINTGRANDLAKEALTQQLIPSLANNGNMQAEVKWDTHTRFDFKLGEHTWVEVKSVSQRIDNGAAAFPDAISTRGQKHLQVLMDTVRQGHKAVQLYMVMRDDITHFEPARHIDPVYEILLCQAQKAGVVTLAYSVTMRVSEKESWLNVGQALDVKLCIKTKPY